MIEFLYKAVFLIPSLIVIIIGTIANSLASAAHLIGSFADEYFTAIYGPQGEDESE